MANAFPGLKPLGYSQTALSGRRLRAPPRFHAIALDEAVFAAYGWDAGLSDEEILERLLELNLDRSKERG